MTGLELQQPWLLDHCRIRMRQGKSESDDMLSLLKALIIQYGLPREEEHVRVEKDRKYWTYERLIEPDRRAEDSRRHD